MNDISTKIKKVISMSSLSKEGEVYISEPGVENSKELFNLGDAMQKEIKRKFKTISQRECLTIFFKCLYKEIKDLEREKPKNNVMLTDLLKEKIENLSEKIISYCKTIPRKYIVNFDIPLFHGDETIGTDNLNYRISIGKGVAKDAGHGLLKNERKHNGVYLNADALRIIEKKGLICQSSGIYTGKKSNAYHDALSVLKLVVQQGLSRNIYVCRDLNQPPAPKNIMEWIQLKDDRKEIPTFYMYIVDNETSSASKEKLSDDISCFLNRLEVDFESELFRGGKEDYVCFLDKLMLLYEYMAYKEKGRFQNVLAAIEWCFDSYSIEEESETLSFLNVCFGLEALFGSGDEDSELDKLTLGQKLSLKCAYLISQGFDERIKIIKDIKDIYKCRSKLVHGNRNRLNFDESSLLHTGRTYLEKSIIKELDLRFVPI